MAKAALFEEEQDFPESSRAAKRVKLLSDEEDSDSSESNSSGGVKLNGTGEQFSINQEYARRFEHNSKRAELHRLEEKYGKDKAKRLQGEDSEQGSEDESSSSDEDDDVALASGALEANFNATLQAIRNKDPRIYKTEEKFYESDDEDQKEHAVKAKKPMFLSDYHRQNLLNGDVELDREEPILSYDQQQNELRKSLVKEMHEVQDESEDGSDQDGMFQVKRRPTPPIQQKTITTADVEQADQDPENFLSRFLESRAWVANGGTGAHPFESDDEDEDRKAEEFETAYNLRFENANGVNEKLVSHARDTAAKYSVRDENKSRRQRARETEKAKKEELKSERAREKAQLKKLRVEEMEKKLEKIKEAAGGKNAPVKLDEWADFIADDWDDDKWEVQMRSKFDEKYYAEPDNEMSGEESSKKKVSKPKWEDDIDIGDIIPDFEEDGQFSLSEDDTEQKASKKQRKAAIEEQKKESRKNKRKLERLAEEKVNLDIIMQRSDNKNVSKFKYRDTSPVNWGMSSRDILMATDTQLNQFAGLKKLASFREAEKRKRDKKKLGKKARLRQWRKETFGDADGPQKTIQDLMREAQDDGFDLNEHEPRRTADSATNGSGKRKRSKKNKPIETE